MSLKILIAKVIFFRNFMYLGIVPPSCFYNLDVKAFVLSTVLSAFGSVFCALEAISFAYELERGEAGEQALPL
jgi:hypothetical protein